jgi:hypothetical protein
LSDARAALLPPGIALPEVHDFVIIKVHHRDASAGVRQSGQETTQ